MLDAYYTPDDVARRIVVTSGFLTPGACADTTCGTGNLLRAAQQLYPKVACIGADKDRAAIRGLRRQQPQWLLSVADILDSRSRSQAAAFRPRTGCDLLLLNPPFSMPGKKSVDVLFDESCYRVSVAMAHILRSVDIMSPTQGAIAIVPESLLYSDLDRDAREALKANFKLETFMTLSSSTFRGARARTSVLRLERRGSTPESEACLSISRSLGPTLTRGGLPHFEAEPSRRGLPYVHSTDLRFLSAGGDVLSLRRVRPIHRGRVMGSVVLLPRVGVPSVGSFQAVTLKSEVQLSDCVIAITCKSRAEADGLARQLRQRREEVEALYRGTGARYITVSTLQDFVQGSIVSTKRVAQSPVE